MSTMSPMAVPGAKVNCCTPSVPLNSKVTDPPPLLLKVPDPFVESTSMKTAALAAGELTSICTGTDVAPPWPSLAAWICSQLMSVMSLFSMTYPISPLRSC